MNALRCASLIHAGESGRAFRMPKKPSMTCWRRARRIAHKNLLDSVAQPVDAHCASIFARIG